MNAADIRKILAYNADTGVFTWAIKTGKKPMVGAIAGSTTANGYTRIRIYKKLYLAHRLAWLYVYGRTPKAEIDHVNQIKSDNRISNLREASSAQNKQNRKTQLGPSKYRGVTWLVANQKWRASIGHNYKNVYIGLFDTAEEASAAYCARAAELHSHTSTKVPYVKS